MASHGQQLAFLQSIILSAIRTEEKRGDIRTAVFPLVNSEKRWNTSYSTLASNAAVGSSKINY